MESESLGTVGVEQKEKLKLVRNSKGYNWEIVILSLDIDRLKELDEEMKNKFGDNSKNENA